MSKLPKTVCFLTVKMGIIAPTSFEVTTSNEIILAHRRHYIDAYFLPFLSKSLSEFFWLLLTCCFSFPHHCVLILYIFYMYLLINVISPRENISSLRIVYFIFCLKTRYSEGTYAMLVDL